MGYLPKRTKAKANNSMKSQDYIDQANLCVTQGDFTQSIIFYKKALKLDLKNPTTWYDLACSFIRLKKSKEASSAYKEVIKLKPNYTEASTSLGFLLNQSGNYDESLKYFQLAAKSAPKTYWVFNNLAFAYSVKKDYLKTIACLKKCLKLNPDFAPALNQLYLTYRSTCMWDEAGKMEKILDEKQCDSPYISLIRSDDPQKNLEAAKRYSEEIIKHTPFPNFSYVHSSGKKIRLGYIASGFNSHVSHLAGSIFNLHDRKEFEIYVYSHDSDDKSFNHQEVKKGADKFTDISLFSNLESAQLINKDCVDILVDLNGYIRGDKPEICAMRPAPIQTTYLGFSGSTGAPFFDYNIVDKIVIPPSQAHLYTEKLIYLPHCYQINNSNLPPSIYIPKRSDFGLPPRSPKGEGVVFVSWNQMLRFDPILWSVWIKILKQVPGSVLWMWEQNKIAIKNLQNYAKKSGINPNRLIFSPRILSRTDHLARLQLADIALDTRIYNGHTTTSNCLWAGVPVITLLGNHFASRVTASILTEAGLSELITKSLKEYENLAVALVKNPITLQKFKQKLSHKNLLKNLYNAKRTVKDLEESYEKMWKDYLDNPR